MGMNALPLSRWSAVIIAFAAIALFGAEAPAEQKIASGSGSFQFTDEQVNPGKPLTVLTYAPVNLAADSPIAFLMCGASRDAQGMRQAWISHAYAHKMLLILPEFSKADYPDLAYQCGHVIDSQHRPVEPSKWTFNVIEHLFDRVKEMAGNKSTTYFIYGHSAGGQFVHRFVLFMPDARYARALAANPGTYAMPDVDTPYPYGFKGTNMTDDNLKRAMGREFVLLLGERDTNRDDPNLVKNALADAQGLNRLERGKNYFSRSRETAQRLKVDLAWKLRLVPNAGHVEKLMAEAAVREMFRSRTRAQ
jgi:poly(3-hydroxybutyrate) depolymerase